MGTGSLNGKKVNIFILVLQGPSFAKGNPRAAMPSAWGGYEMRRRCFTGGPRAGWRFLRPLPGRGRASAARSRPFMSPCSWERAVPVNTTGGSRASAKQAAARPRDSELFAALLSLYPCQLAHTWDFTSCLPTAAPFPPCDLILRHLLLSRAASLIPTLPQ